MSASETSLTNILGQEFGPYKLVRRLGVGGMAETFVAIRRGPSGFTQRVCLKLVLPFYRENKDFVALFEREARLAAKLRHRNIVGVIDFGEFEGTSYMALELVDGLDLRHILEAQPGERLAWEYVALLGLELAEALEHAHHPPSSAGITATDDDVLGIVHRDISPSNVLVSKQGEILLSDFGVAKAMTGTSRKQSAVKGKVPYMSPEQLRAEPLDGRADLFALGVVLYETLAGERPYDGAHDPATIMQILKGEHPALHSRAPDAPAEFCALVEQLLKPDRDERPTTAAELIDALEDFASSPRTRRKLGRLVRKLRENTDQQKLPTASSQPSAGTEVLSDEDAPTPAPRSASHEALPLRAPPAAAPDPTSAPVAHAEVDNRGPAGGGTRPLDPAPGPHEGPTGVKSKSLAEGPEPMAEAEPTRGPAPDYDPALMETDPIDLTRPPSQGWAGARTVTPAPGTAGAESTSDRDWRDDAELPERRLRRAPMLGAAAVALFAAVGVVVAAWPEAEPSPSPEAIHSDDDPRLQLGDDAIVPTASDRQKPIGGDEKRLEQDGRLEGSPGPTPQSAREADKAPPAEDPPEVDGRIGAKTAAPVAPPAGRKPSASPKQTGEPTTKATGPGRLTITVFPWGNIWINGQPWGRAPLKSEELPPGRYRISVGQSKPTETRSIRLRSGQRRTVHFELAN